MTDKAVRGEADKTDVEVNTLSSAVHTTQVQEVYATPPDVIAKDKAAAAGK